MRENSRCNTTGKNKHFVLDKYLCYSIVITIQSVKNNAFVYQPKYKKIFVIFYISTYYYYFVYLNSPKRLRNIKNYSNINLKSYSI